MPIFTSRWRALAFVVLVLLALDAARSLYARLGYAHPTAMWQPDPKVYADLTWPPGADVAATADLGTKVFAQHCAVCHGPDGRGNGPAAPSLIPRPRDFTRADFRYKSTPAGVEPRDDDLIFTVTNGLTASAMPSFKGTLTPAEIQAVAAHVKGVAGLTAGSQPHALAIPARPAPNAQSLARGKDLYRSLGCAACHGDDGRLRQRLADAKGYPLQARDLTAPWTFRRGAEPREIWTRIETGLGPMPAFAKAATPQQIWDVANYVGSLARIPPWERGGKLDGPGFAADKLARGDYMIHAMMCGLCHTQINPTGIYRADDAYLAGGMRAGVYPHGFFITRNLTSDAETGLGKWTDTQVAEALRNGHSPGRTLDVVDMPWNWLHALTPDDALSIAAALKALPAVRNEIPPPLRYGVIETVVMKLMRPLPAALPLTLTYAEGNFGNRTGAALWLPSVLAWLQGIVLVVGLILIWLAGPNAQRVPQTMREWVLLGAIGFAGLLVAGFAWMLFYLPALPVIPPQEVAKAAVDTVYQPPPDALDTPEHQAMVARGRYLFTVASCALCHQGNGSGGMKISWRPMGSIWSANLTSDPGAGIGKWTDAEIARAIRSGISRSGRPLHWQGMIWDHSSNWDEEDVRSLIAFLRTLPAIAKPRSDPFPPSAADCAVYTFFPVVDQAPKSGCTVTE